MEPQNVMCLWLIILGLGVWLGLTVVKNLKYYSLTHLHILCSVFPRRRSSALQTTLSLTLISTASNRTSCRPTGPVSTLSVGHHMITMWSTKSLSSAAVSWDWSSSTSVSSSLPVKLSSRRKPEPLYHCDTG